MNEMCFFLYPGSDGVRGAALESFRGFLATVM